MKRAKKRWRRRRRRYNRECNRLCSLAFSTEYDYQEVRETVQRLEALNVFLLDMTNGKEDYAKEIASTQALAAEYRASAEAVARKLRALWDYCR